MSDYTRSEILNETAKLFRARIENVKHGGILNTRAEYDQLKEMASVTFVMNPEAIFYLAFLASNRLAATVSREVALLEDMLVSLDDLGQVATGVPDTTDINNASTTLLALDAASSVKNRPEVGRFSNLMDKVAGSYRPNLTSISKPGRVVQPREEAQSVIRSDLAQLEVVHGRMLTALTALRDLLSTFDSLDVPSKVSSNVFAQVREALGNLSNSITSNSVSESVAESRQSALTVLASKTAVNILADFRDPGELKLRSPVNPIPPTLIHKGRAAGVATPASILSGPGPWTLPISSALEFRVDGGSQQQVTFDNVVGVALNGTASEPFGIGIGSRDLNVVVDQEQYAATIDTANTQLTVSETTLLETVSLGFKHLGALVSYPDADASINPNNMYQRALVAMPRLQDFMASTFSPTTKLLIVTLPGTPDAGAPFNLESNVGFVSGHEGMYISDALGELFEITEVVINTSPPNLACYIDDRGETFTVGAISLHGQRVTTWNPNLPGTDQSPTRFTVSPALDDVPVALERVLVGPSIKTARLTATTVAGIVAEINLLASTSADTGHVGADLGLHALAAPVAGDPTKLSLQPRSKINPLLTISANFLKPLVGSGPGPMEIISETASSTLGLPPGASIVGSGFDTNDVMTPGELAGRINDVAIGVLASADNETLTSGVTLSSVAGTKNVQDTTKDFVAAGVKAGYVVEILSGPESGNYAVTNVAATVLTLNKLATFSSNSAGRSYNILRLGVRIASKDETRSSSIEVTGPPDLGFPSGVYYGEMDQFEALDPNRVLLPFQSLVQVNDTIRLVGVGSFTVTEVVGTKLSLSPGIPSNTSGVGFEVLSKSAEAFSSMQANLQTFTTSGALLRKNGYDASLAQLDAALTSVLLQGQNFASSRGRARQFLVDLLSVMTSNPKRSDEYTATVSPAAITLLEELSAYQVVPLVAVDSFVGALRERKYDRAVDLFIRGQLTEFYETDEESGSYGGAVASSSRRAVRDLPTAASSQVDVENFINLATGTADGPDPENDFDDYDSSLEIDL